MTKHLHIIGIVQGVGYRAAFARKADSLRLCGWVRNRADGSVDATVSGPADALDEMIEWARRGPAAAQVREISITEVADPVVAAKHFEILPTE